MTTTCTADQSAQQLGYTSFADLMKKNERLVCAEVRRYAPTQAEFEDMLQEVWVKVSQRIHQFLAKNNAKLSTWLHPVARNTCLSYLDKLHNSNVKGALCYEHQAGGNNDELSLEDFGPAGAHSPSAEDWLIAKQTAQRVVLGSVKTAKSRREAGVAAMLDIYGFDMLAELVSAKKEELSSHSAEFLAEVLLMETQFASEEAHVAAWEALTETLGGRGNQAVFTGPQLVDLARQYSFEPELSITQIATLLDRTVENVRVHNSRGSEDVIKFAAPDYYSEVQNHRESRRKTRVPA